MALGNLMRQKVPEIRFFSRKGVLVSLSLSGPQLERVVIDRTLVGRLISDTISDVPMVTIPSELSFDANDLQIEVAPMPRLTIKARGQLLYASKDALTIEKGITSWSLDSSEDEVF
ncbi:UNVERIFIED_CONTAM: hypothetical protein K2H54_044266 [Gekko kuhli]